MVENSNDPNLLKSLQSLADMVKIQGDPFKMSQTSGVAPCKRRF